MIHKPLAKLHRPYLKKHLCPYLKWLHEYNGEIYFLWIFKTDFYSASIVIVMLLIKKKKKSSQDTNNKNDEINISLICCSFMKEIILIIIIISSKSFLQLISASGIKNS